MADYDVIIIGAGPAGMTAAVYASRAGLKTAMLESSSPGGKLVKTYEIENWPGIKGTEGATLATNMYEHATNFGAEDLYGNVIELKDGDVKTIVCDDGVEYTASAVIIATGTVERKMQIPNEEEMIGKGVSFCAVCDGAFYRGKDVLIVGGGNAALEEALHLTRFAAKVTIVIRRAVFRAEPIIQQQVEANEKISVVINHIPREVLVEDGKVVGLLVEHVETGEQQRLAAAGIFPYIGADPATQFVAGLGITDERGYLLVNEKMETAREGIYGAGDVCAKNLRQVVTATSDGAIAAQQIFQRLQK